MISNHMTYVVTGTSMQPTIDPGDTISVSPGSTIVKNDLVIIHFVARKVPLVKRVIGVPGDVLDDKMKVPDWLTLKTIPIDTYYVYSDNPASQFDSRKFGLVSLSQIIGVVNKIYKG